MPKEPAPAPAPASPARRKRKKRTVYAPVQCLICKDSFPKLTRSHLALHGYTIERYCITFGVQRGLFKPSRGPFPPPGVDSAASPGAPTVPAGRARDEVLAIIANGHAGPEGALLARRIAEELVGDPEFLQTLADEVEQTIVTSSLRPRLTSALASILAARLETHGAALSLLERVRGELGQTWRIEQGGDDGGPTPTRDLTGMHFAANAELKTAEDLVLRAVKLAIDEKKGQDPSAAAQPLDGVRYSGQMEAAAIPSDLTPAEREAMRNLAALLQKGIAARRSLDAVAAERQGEDAD
jgi:hypothetical protein